MKRHDDLSRTVPPRGPFDPAPFVPVKRIPFGVDMATGKTVYGDQLIDPNISVREGETMWAGKYDAPGAMPDDERFEVGKRPAIEGFSMGWDKDGRLVSVNGVPVDPRVRLRVRPPLHEIRPVAALRAEDV